MQATGMSMKILVTGASGFVGAATARRLEKDGAHKVRRAVRTTRSDFPDTIAVGDIGGATDWRFALEGVDVVVHTAARVHMMQDRALDPLAAFRHVNVEGSVRLARQAAQAGIHRLVFISSVKVNGEATLPGQPFRPQDPVARPGDPYGISKYEAEQELREVGAQTGMEIVVVRPVLVYGPGVRANFENMMRWIDRGLPLPLGAIHDNRRSLVALDNLCDLIACCVAHPAAAGEIFFAADGEDVSTTDLLQRVAAALCKPARLLPVSPVLLQTCMRMIGRAKVAQRLCESLQVDIDANAWLLGWRPSVTLDAALAQTASAFRAAQATNAGNTPR